MAYKTYLPSAATQREPESANQVPNNAGGYTFTVTPEQKLLRFLILGTEGGTYYQDEKKHTKDNYESVKALIRSDYGPEVPELVFKVSDENRAPKNEPAILVLAACTVFGSDVTRRAAYAVLPNVCRIPTHLFHFLSYRKAMREGNGKKGALGSRGSRRAVAQWYQVRAPQNLAYTTAKYQQRDGWSNRDVLRLARPHPDQTVHSQVPTWNDVTKCVIGKGDRSQIPVLAAIDECHSDGLPLSRGLELIRQFNLSHEMLPSAVLKLPEVWEAFLESGIGYTALIRNLGRMGSLDLLTQGSNASKRVLELLANTEEMKKKRVHPLAILQAGAIYESGKGIKGDLTWKPNQRIVDGLTDAFYAAFDQVPSTGKRFYLACDVSASMEWGPIAGMPPITPQIGAAVMALLTMKREQASMIYGFSNDLVEVPISPRMRLDAVIQTMAGIPMGGTDCSAPMLHALRDKLAVDTFVVYTDNETWAGSIHPHIALEQYRQKMGLNAKLIVCGMTATEFTIADPADFGMLDVVGFDSNTPQAISEFAMM
jgi:60 kDa SS-A/Ro ribonucleoprotein